MRFQVPALPQASTLSCYWSEETAVRQFRTGVSLHGHTLHSRESLDFVPTVCGKNPVLQRILDSCQKKHRASTGVDVDFTQAWWTPPVCARQAIDLERLQIENSLGHSALVSITDHDNIEAARLMSTLTTSSEQITSVEWSVPYGSTMLHLGIHNIESDIESKMSAMASFTDVPKVEELAALLEWFGSNPATLIVLNHPLWDAFSIGATCHLQGVEDFIGKFGKYIHAFELNGLRSWKENQTVIEMAKAMNFPIISGGDRHGTEPNAILNMTNAATFPEFVEEIREDAKSDVMVMPQYRQSTVLRLMQNIGAALADYPAHSLGQTQWSDRIFYRGEDGIVRSLNELWGKQPPAAVRTFIALSRLLHQNPLQSSLRHAFGWLQPE